MVVLLELTGTETIADLRDARDSMKMKRLTAHGIMLDNISETISKLDDAILDALATVD